MGGNMWGADIEGLRNLASIFDSAASDVTGSITAVSSALSTTPWVGVDAEQFQNQWTSTTQPQLQTIADRLVQGSDDLRRHADQQEGASTEGGGLGGGPGSGWGPGDGGGGGFWDDLLGGLSTIVGLGSLLVSGINQTLQQLDIKGKVATTLKGLGRGLGVAGLVLGGVDLVDAIIDGDGWRAGDALVGMGLGVAGLLALSNPVGWAVLGAGAVWMGLSHFIDGPVTEWAWNGITTAADWVGDTAIDAWNATTDFVGDAWNAGTEFVSDTASNVVDGVSDFAGDVAGGVSDAVGGAVDAVSSF